MCQNNAQVLMRHHGGAEEQILHKSKNIEEMKPQDEAESCWYRVTPRSCFRQNQISISAVNLFCLVNLYNFFFITFKIAASVSIQESIDFSPRYIMRSNLLQTKWNTKAIEIEVDILKIINNWVIWSPCSPLRALHKGFPVHGSESVSCSVFTVAKSCSSCSA